MARILVIQRHKMLQQAIVLALFPDHHVRVLEKIPAVEPPAEVDVVIIDSAASGEGESSLAGEISPMESWRLPVILIGAGPVNDQRTSKHCRRLNRPVHRDDLRAAVAECVDSRAQRRSAPAVEAKRKTSGAGSNGVTLDKGKEVIELTDVIEEMPGYNNCEMEASNKA